MSPSPNDHAGSLSSRPLFQWKSLSSPLRLFLSLCVTLDLITLIALPYYHRVYNDAARIQIWSLQADRFGDFWHYHELFDAFHTQAFFTSADRFAYPAPCAAVYRFLYHLGPRPHIVFSAMLFAVLFASAFLFYRTLLKYGVKQDHAFLVAAFLVLTSYPWEKLFDRANIELFVYLFLALGMWAYLTGRKSLAAAMWGCAGAMKIYPLIMLALFLHRKTLRPLLTGVFTFAGVLLASFWYVGPTIKAAAIGSITGITGFIGNYAANAHLRELTIDHSILGAMKELLLLDTSHIGGWQHLSTIYQAIVIIGGPILYFVRIRKLPALNQMCLFLTAIVLLPPVSYDYTLIHIYLVMGIIVTAYLSAMQRGEQPQSAKAFAVIFALLTSSEGWAQHSLLRVNGVIKCAALLALCWLLLRIPLTLGLDAKAEATAAAA
jgi:hypothetical protein